MQFKAGRANAVWLLGFLAGQIKTHPPIVSPFPQKEFRFLPIFFKNQIVVVNMVNASVVGFYSLVLLLGSPNILYSDSAKKKDLIMCLSCSEKLHKILPISWFLNHYYCKIVMSFCAMEIFFCIFLNLNRQGNHLYMFT